MFSRWTLAVAGLVVVAGQARAQCAGERLVAGNGAGGDWFGSAVSMSADTILVGARNADGAVADVGGVYVFMPSPTGWTETELLHAADAEAGDWFGTSVAMHGTTALIGAARDDEGASDAGSAYVFQRTKSGWVEADKLVASNGAAGDWFGFSSIALFDDMALVGATRNGAGGPGSGSVYFFERGDTGWSEVANFAGGTNNAWFGSTVHLMGSRALAGAPGSFASTVPGSVTVFEHSGSTWSASATLSASDGVVGNAFGSALAMRDETVFVGAVGDGAGGFDSGAVYVFEKRGSNWSEVQKLTAGDAESGDWFGSSIAISGGQALIGARRDDGSGSDAGAMYLFEETESGWTEVVELTADNPADDEQFGWPVLFDDNKVVVGAHGTADPGFEAGAVHVLDIFGGVAERYCVSAPNSAGANGSRMGWFGSLSLQDDHFQLLAHEGPAGQLGLFYMGSLAQEQPFGDGFRCIGGRVFRLGPMTPFNIFGGSALTLDLSQGAPSLLGPGREWMFQFWYHDPAAGASGFNLSDGLRVRFCP